MNRVEVPAELFDWALERARVAPDVAGARFPRLGEWRAGRVRPTLKQLEAFARATHTPIGFFFLSEPPVESIPIPDFRTIRDEGVTRPSADLLDTIYSCQQRQEWYRDHARSMGEEGLPFVGSVDVGDDIPETAEKIRDEIGLDLERRRRAGTWEAALRDLMALVEDSGILVMCNGIVHSNTHRKLNPQEFRGFAMADPLAPLVFVNGADTKSAQMFTLAHELVHIGLGSTALSDAPLLQADALTLVGHVPGSVEVERWCNAVAAELLVPLAVLQDVYNPAAPLAEEMESLARRFKVSTLVVLRRMYDAGGLGRDTYWTAFHEELDRLRSVRDGGGGASFYNTEGVRVSRRFARALIASTLEGQTLYRDALRMLSIRKFETFTEFGRRLGVIA